MECQDCPNPATHNCADCAVPLCPDHAWEFEDAKGAWYCEECLNEWACEAAFEPSAHDA